MILMRNGQLWEVLQNGLKVGVVYRLPRSRQWRAERWDRKRGLHVAIGDAPLRRDAVKLLMGVS